MSAKCWRRVQPFTRSVGRLLDHLQKYLRQERQVKRNKIESLRTFCSPGQPNSCRRQSDRPAISGQWIHGPAMWELRRIRSGITSSTALAARSLAAWATTGSFASICSMAFFRSAMSSIIAKPLRRQSHRWHNAFAVVPSKPLRSNLSDYRRSCWNRNRGRQSRRWQRSSLGTAQASCTLNFAGD